MEVIGWLGAFLLGFCGLPQAIHSYRHKNAEGVSWLFLTSWIAGEILTLAYVSPKLDWPLMANYAFNIALIACIIYYKWYGASRNNQTPKSAFETEESLSGGDNAFSSLPGVGHVSYDESRARNWIIGGSSGSTVENHSDGSEQQKVFHVRPKNSKPSKKKIVAKRGVSLVSRRKVRSKKTK